VGGKETLITLHDSTHARARWSPLICICLLAACGEAQLQARSASEQSAPATSSSTLLPANADDQDVTQTAELLSEQVEPVQEPPSPQLLAAWGPISALAGRSWVLMDEGAAQHLHYQWADTGAALTFSGLDRDGNVLAGRFMIDPAIGAIAGLSIFRGDAFEQTVTLERDGFTITTTTGPEPNRARYIRLGVSGYRVEREVFRANRWRPTRIQTLSAASPAIIAALGWEARSAEREAAEEQARAELFERRPTFFSRLGAAFQDGLTTGVEEGVRERVRGAITNEDPNDVSYDSDDDTVEAEDTSDPELE
jgi:hypothetical protein